MATANYTATLIEALAGPEPLVSEGIHREQKVGRPTTSFAPTQRNPTPRDFVVPGAVVALSISWPARLVFSEIINLRKVKGEVWANDNHFAERCRISKRTVGGALRELEVAGLLLRITRQSAQRKRNLIPLLIQEKHYREEVAEEQCLVQPSPEAIATTATELMQNLQQPIAAFASINTTSNTKLKNNQSLLASAQSGELVTLIFW